MRPRWHAPGKVTISIGLISKQTEKHHGEIILAADSETGYGDGSKDLDTKKLHEIQFADGRILMADAGILKNINLALAFIRDNAHSISMKNWQNVKDVIDKSMRQVRDSLLEGLNLNDERRSSFLRIDCYFELLIGFYCGGKPYLVHVDIEFCNASPVERSDFAAIGIGNDLAKYLLKEFKAADAGFALGQSEAISVIETVKANVKGCSGPTQVGLVWPMDDTSATVIIDASDVANTAKALSKQWIEMDASRREALIKSLERAACGRLGIEIGEHFRGQFKTK